MEVGFQTVKIELALQHFEQGKKKSWQTIVKKIRVGVSRKVNRLRAVKVTDKRLAGDKVSKGANKVALKKVVSRATANLLVGDEVSPIGSPRIAPNNTKRQFLCTHTHSFRRHLHDKEYGETRDCYRRFNWYRL